MNFACNIIFLKIFKLVITWKKLYSRTFFDILGIAAERIENIFWEVMRHLSPDRSRKDKGCVWILVRNYHLRKVYRHHIWRIWFFNCGCVEKLSWESWQNMLMIFLHLYNPKREAEKRHQLVCKNVEITNWGGECLKK